MASKYVDTVSIMQVIGCVFNNPALLDFTDKYTITDNDFPDDFHKIVFGAIYKLHESGVNTISLETINDFLAGRPKSESIFKQQKGEEWLLRISDTCTPAAFDYYYNKLKKMSLLRAYDNYGIDVKFIYDPTNILDIKKKQAQEEKLDNLTLEDIANEVDKRIDNIRMEYVDDEFGEASQAGDNIFDLINNLKEHPEVGVPLYGPLINTITRGARLKKFYLRSAATGVGKAIPNDTLIPTPEGWRKVGDIKEGDYLFGRNGLPTKVLKIHPQPEQKNIWKVYFADGRVAKCCGEHLWEYRYDTHGGEAYRVEDTQTIYNRTLNLKGGFKSGINEKGYRFHIKINEPVQYEEKQYYISPYVMGAFLGDGSFRYNITNKSLRFSSENDELPILITKELGKGFYYHKNSRFNFNYNFKHIDNQTHPIWVEEFLKDYPALWNVKSEEKFIPEEYLMGSIEQRFDLLQGLMDTDGSIDEKGRISFTTVSPKLKDNFIELCHSLGFITSYSTDQRKEKYTTGECYNIHIQCKKQLKPKLFRLQRKADKALRYAVSDKREEHKNHLAIVNIEKTEEKTDMTCFTVDNEEHLFLTNDFIVTHNTRSMIADACYMSCNKIYDENFGWIRCGSSEPTLYITTEQELEEVQTMMLAFISNVNEEHILNGKYEGDEEERVLEAAKILKNAPLYIEEMPDFSLQDIEDRIRRNIRDHDVRCVCHDYIHTSIKILEEITRRSGGVKLREDNILFMLAIRLKDLCNEYGIFIMSATQLNSSYVESEAPDQNLLRGAKSIADWTKFYN